jgi:hypothetical protein
MGRRLAIGFLASVMLAVVPAAASAVVPVGNLLVDPGAEAGVGASDSSGVSVPEGWTTTETMTAVKYGASSFPTVEDGAAVDGGVNFFAGGPAAEASSATQTVDVSAAASEIDTGALPVTVSALLGGFASQADAASVTATFLSAAGPSLSAVTLPAVTPAERGDVTKLVPRALTATVPTGTRAIEVRIDAVRTDGSYNDGYADNISLVLGAPPVYHRSVVTGTVSGTILVRRPGAGGYVTLTGAQTIPLGSTVDARKGKVALTSVPRPGAPPQTATFYDGIFRVTQPGSVTVLTLVEPLARCVDGRAASAAAAKKKRRLWGDGAGSFSVKGQYSAATVRGTRWLVEDSCAGTLTRVVHGSVSVRDNVRNKTIIVRAGQSYRARPARRG